jgi:tetratricopeptide (TPR) repeat protein
VIARFVIVLLSGAALAVAQTATFRNASTDQQIVAVAEKLKQDPNSADLRDQLAGAFLQKMRETADGSYLERANRLVEATLKADARDYRARRRQIEIELQRHHFKQVVALAESLTKEDRKDAAVWGMLGDALMEIGDYDRAADVYQTAADLRPDMASYNRVAFYRFVTGDAEGAIDIMRRAVRAGSRQPENVAWCLAELGRMLLKTGAVEEADQAFRQALDLFPRYHPALAGLGRAHAARGRYGDAIVLLLKAEATVPFPEYAGLLAKLYRRTGKPDLANRQIALLDVADTLDRSAGEMANRNLSLALADLRHRTARALSLAQAELNVRQDVYTYDALAWALFQDGQIAEAAQAMDRALSQNSPEPSFHDHAAHIFAAAGRAEDAKTHRSQARADYW